MGTWNEIDDLGNVISWAQCDQEVGLNPLPSHSLLPDLTADDHLQYLTAARGNALYSLLTHTHVPADIVGATWITNIVEDLTPQLGGSLDTNNQQIISTAGVNITITPGTTGDLVLDGLNWPQADGTANYVLETDGAGQLAWAENTGGLINIVDDTTPQLGGSLDVNGQSIVSVSGGNIAITPDTTGSVILDGLNWPQVDGTANYVLETDGAGQLAWVAQSAAAESNDLTAAVTWANVPDANITQSSVTQHEAAINHNALANFISGEHIDWTADAGADNIHVNNITAVPEAAVTAHQAALSVTESQISDLDKYTQAQVDASEAVVASDALAFAIAFS